jgi:hypothetical protein
MNAEKDNNISHTEKDKNISYTEKDNNISYTASENEEINTKDQFFLKLQRINRR